MDKHRLYTVQATEAEIGNIGYNRAVRAMRKRVMVLVGVAGTALVLASINAGMGYIDDLLMTRVVAGVCLGCVFVASWFFHKCGKAGKAFAKEIKEQELKRLNRTLGYEGGVPGCPGQ